MAGRWRKTALVLVGALALALVAGASAASPDVAAMNLQVADVPGAKIISASTLKEKRLRLGVPAGVRVRGAERQSRLVAVRDRDGARVERASSRPPTPRRPRRRFARRSVASSSSPDREEREGEHEGHGRRQCPRKLPGYDQGFDAAGQPAAEGQAGLRDPALTCASTAWSSSWSRSCLRPVRRGCDGEVRGGARRPHRHRVHARRDLTADGHGERAVRARRSPQPREPGRAATRRFTYQWQRCDAAGANCVPVAGATAPTYAVLPTDVGATLNVVVTAANRFGRPERDCGRAATPACDLDRATLRARKHRGAPWLRRGRFSG